MNWRAWATAYLFIAICALSPNGDTAHMSWLAIGIYLAGGLFLFGLSLLERATWQQAIWCIPFFLVPISLAYALTHYGPDIDRFRPVWISIGLILIVILVFVPIRPRRLKTKTYTVTIGGPIHFDHKK